MFSKRTLVSGLVAFVAMSLVTTLIWMIVGSTWMNMSDVAITVEQNKVYLTLSYLVMAWVMASKPSSGPSRPAISRARAKLSRARSSSPARNWA